MGRAISIRNFEDIMQHYWLNVKMCGRGGIECAELQANVLHNPVAEELLSGCAVGSESPDRRGDFTGASMCSAQRG